MVLVALIWGVGKNRKGPHPATYKMSEEWTHDPILWASDEPVDTVIRLAAMARTP